ncbi:hypothetical protein [Rossellomorea sp. LjRoot5]
MSVVVLLKETKKASAVNLCTDKIEESFAMNGTPSASELKGFCYFIKHE